MKRRPQKSRKTQPEKHALCLWWLATGRRNSGRERNSLILLVPVQGQIVRVLFGSSTGDKFTRVRLEPDDTPVIAPYSLLPASLRPRKAFSMLCMVGQVCL